MFTQKKRLIFSIFNTIFLCLSTILVFTLYSKGDEQELIVYDHNGMWGYTDKTGKVIIEAQFYSANNFSEGVAAVKLRDDSWTYIDTTGKFITKSKFQTADDFQNGVGVVYMKNNKYGVIDKTGKIVRTLNDYNLAGKYREQQKYGTKLTVKTAGNKMGYVDALEEYLIKPQFDDAKQFQDGLAFVKIDNKWGCINEKGEFIFKPEFDSVPKYYREITLVEKNKKFGYLKGKFYDMKYLVNPQFDYADQFYGEEIAKVIFNGKEGYINKTGKYAIDPQFTEKGIFLEDKKTADEKFSKEILDCTESIKLNSNNATAYHRRAIAYINKKELKKALADLLQAVQLAQKPEIYKDLGKVYIFLFEYDKAISALSSAIKIDAKFADAYYNRGIAYEGELNINLALKDYNQAIQLQPKMESAYARRGSMYYLIRQFDKALGDFNQAIVLNDRQSDFVYFNRGLLYQTKREFNSAILDYTRAILLNPKNNWAYLYRGMCYFEKVKDIIKIRIATVDQLEEKLNLDKKADQDFTEAVRLNPKDIDTYRYLAGIRISQGRYHEAIEYLDKAINSGSNEVSDWFNLGLAHYGLQSYSMAESCFSNALMREPSNKTYNEYLTLARKAIKDKQDRDVDEEIKRNQRQSIWLTLGDGFRNISNSVLDGVNVSGGSSGSSYSSQSSYSGGSSFSGGSYNPASPKTGTDYNAIVNKNIEQKLWNMNNPYK